MKVKRENLKKTLPLPSREQVDKNGWKFQLDWIYDGLPCFERIKSTYNLKARIVTLENAGRHYAVTDLRHADLIDKIEKTNNPVW